MTFYKTLLISYILGLATIGYSQTAVVSSGNNITSSSGSLSFSLGQVVYKTNNNTEGSIHQGVQQAYEIFTLKVEDHRLKPSMTVYPNPTEDIVNLRIDDLNSDKLSYMLFDLQGRLIKQGKLTENFTPINIQDLPSASYIMKISKNQKAFKSFKIIKK
ncbi:MAG: T9SS type A sorting domain-containing protein [Bacteroidetes bacterium]|jgi:hypothetical protein|nr:T9SS type A sorting domain-containing protein [Bacteroidota bacterium]